MFPVPANVQQSNIQPYLAKTTTSPISPLNRHATRPMQSVSPVSLVGPSSSPVDGAGKTVLDEKTRQLLLFAREVRGLLRCQPRCTISFGKFVPAYHSHFGKQCCVYLYGYTKLIELLEAIPTVVQIVGNQKYITLTHREQVKRFSSELTRILRSRKEKKLLITQIAEAFESFYSKSFDLADYGVSKIEDLLSDIWDPGLQLVRSTDDKILAIEIPRKEQTSIEKNRTRTFANEVIELIKTTPDLSIPFSKFIPMYHHYFRRQCRVSDYGFAKLADLFDAISPSTVEVVRSPEPDEDDTLVVAHQYKCRILWDRISALVRGYRGKETLNWVKISEMYRAMYGHKLTTDDFVALRITSFFEFNARPPITKCISVNGNNSGINSSLGCGTNTSSSNKSNMNHHHHHHSHHLSKYGASNNTSYNYATAGIGNNHSNNSATANHSINSESKIRILKRGELAPTPLSRNRCAIRFDTVA